MKNNKSKDKYDRAVLKVISGTINSVGDTITAREALVIILGVVSEYLDGYVEKKNMR